MCLIECSHLCRYGDGTLRMTVEQDVIFPNVPEKSLDAMQQEPMFQRLVYFSMTLHLLVCMAMHGYS